MPGADVLQQSSCAEGDCAQVPGRRWGEGTHALWQHMERDEKLKTSNRGSGLREARSGNVIPHPGRRATDRQ